MQSSCSRFRLSSDTLDAAVEAAEADETIPFVIVVGQGKIASMRWLVRLK